MFAVASRYAEALLSTTPSPEAANAMEAPLNDLAASLAFGSELRDFILNPTVPAAVKKETLQKILHHDAGSLLMRFLFLLIDKNRIDILPSICKEYKRIKDLRQKNIDIHVYSARPMSDAQLEGIREKYRKQYGALTAQVCRHTDETLLGSIRIQIGDVRIDDSLSGRLEGLRSLLTGS